MTTTTAAVSFDVQKAKDALNRATVTENRPGQLMFAKFDIPNEQNGTRTILAVNHHGEQVHLRVDTVTLDCPGDRNLWNYDTHLIVGGDFHFVERIEYDDSPADPAITFGLGSKSGTPSAVVVHNSGFWQFKVA